MKSILIVATLVACSLAAPSLENPSAQWNNFKLTHAKQYSNEEELLRKAIFSSNLLKINEHNKQYEAGHTTYYMGVNQFADLTHDEFVQIISKYKKPQNPLVQVPFIKQVNADVPESIDWREKGAVTAVKNQKQCGSCWAFSATGSMESANIIKNNNTTPLSEQELVDCSLNGDNMGCNGGYMNNAFEYVIEKGLSSEEDYPYQATDGKCHRENLPSQITVKSYTQIKSGSEEDLKNAVGTVGPVSVAVDASFWQFYAGGVYNDVLCGNKEESLNHGVLAVGYGKKGKNEYWIVKNSWGPDWGEKGYIRSIRNNDNNCGIATDSSYPVL